MFNFPSLYRNIYRYPCTRIRKKEYSTVHWILYGIDSLKMFVVGVHIKFSSVEIMPHPPQYEEAFSISGQVVFLMFVECFGNVCDRSIIIWLAPTKHEARGKFAYVSGSNEKLNKIWAC